MIDFTKPVQTRNGQPVQILSTEARDETYPVVGYIGDATSITGWMRDGRYLSAQEDHMLDLVNAPGETVVRYLNFYANGSYGLHKHLEAAKTIAAGATLNSPCVARIRVEIKEGQFDD